MNGRRKIVYGVVGLLALLVLGAAVRLGLEVMWRHEESENRLQGARRMKDILYAITICGMDSRGGRWPDNLNELQPFLKDLDKYLTNPRTGRKNGFVYIKPGEEIIGRLSDPNNTPMLYEADENGKPLDHGLVGYADAHVEWHDKKQGRGNVFVFRGTGA